MEGCLMKGPASFKTGWQREHCSLCGFFFQFSACDFIALNHILSRKPCLKPCLKFKPCLKLFSSQGWEHIPAKKRLGILSHGSAQHASLLNCYPR